MRLWDLRSPNRSVQVVIASDRLNNTVTVLSCNIVGSLFFPACQFNLSVFTNKAALTGVCYDWSLPCGSAYRLKFKRSVAVFQVTLSSKKIMIETVHIDDSPHECLESKTQLFIMFYILLICFVST